MLTLCPALHHSADSPLIVSANDLTPDTSGHKEQRIKPKVHECVAPEWQREEIRLQKSLLRKCASARAMKFCLAPISFMSGEWILSTWRWGTQSQRAIDSQASWNSHYSCLLELSGRSSASVSTQSTQHQLYIVLLISTSCRECDYKPGLRAAVVDMTLSSGSVWLMDRAALIFNFMFQRVVATTKNL